MKLAGWKRVLLAGLMTLSVAGGSLATFTAGDAAAARREWCTLEPPYHEYTCYRY